MTLGNASPRLSPSDILDPCCIFAAALSLSFAATKRFISPELTQDDDFLQPCILKIQVGIVLAPALSINTTFALASMTASLICVTASRMLVRHVTKTTQSNYLDVAWILASGQLASAFTKAFSELASPNTCAVQQTLPIPGATMRWRPGSVKVVSRIESKGNDRAAPSSCDRDARKTHGMTDVFIGPSPAVHIETIFYGAPVLQLAPEATWSTRLVSPSTLFCVHVNPSPNCHMSNCLSITCELAYYIRHILL